MSTDKTTVTGPLSGYVAPRTSAFTFDRKTDPAQMPSESDLYAMGMESKTAAFFMPALCEAFGLQYPPKP